MARLANLLILLLEIRGLSLSLPKHKLRTPVYYTQLSNIITAVSSLLLLIFDQQPFVTTIRYLSTAMLTMTFIITIFVLIPMGGDAKQLLFSGNGLYHHLLCPLVSVASYIFLEKHAGPSAILLSVIFTFIYGITMMMLNYYRVIDGPYPFFRVHDQSRKRSVFFFFTLSAAIALISGLISLLAR